MDEFGNRLRDESIRNLFRERPQYYNEDLCNLFKLRMSMFEKYLPPETKEIATDSFRPQELKFPEFDKKEIRKNKIEEYRKKIPEEKLEEIDEKFFEPPHPEVKTPPSYLKNTADEEELIRLAKILVKQYIYLYPEGPRDFLVLPNEFGVEKIVCTTLCPYFRVRPELRDWKRCSEFLVDFLEYEPHPYVALTPTKLPSPEYTMEHRKGNSLEFSMVLCSLLLSADYDAYVVQGYGTRDLCFRNEKHKPCPVFRPSTKALKYENLLKERAEEKQPISNKYEDFINSYDTSLPSSEYIGTITEAKHHEEEHQKEEESRIAEHRIRRHQAEEDNFYGRRVHFWVLIKPGKRDIQSEFFLESTTGEEVSTGDANYLGIDFVWNNRNFWVNKQVTSVRMNCSGVSFDFSNSANWDFFFPVDSNGISTLPDDEAILQVPMPDTWVKAYDITDCDMLMPLPNGFREIVYERAKVEKSNPFHNSDGCVLKVTTFHTRDLEEVKHVRCFFRNRNDFLAYRKDDRINEIVTELFEEGREDGLREHSYTFGSKTYDRCLQYYPLFGPNGLVKLSITKSEVFEEFLERKDFLSTRKVTFWNEVGPPTEQVDNEPVTAEVPDESSLLKSVIGPDSFKELAVLLEDIDYNKWNFEDFQKNLDPAHFYLSESETEDNDATERRPKSEPTDSIEDGNPSDEEFEISYKLWVDSLKFEITVLDDEELEPVHEDLVEGTDELKTKLGMLKKKLRARKKRDLTEGFKRAKRCKKIREVRENIARVLETSEKRKSTGQELGTTVPTDDEVVDVDDGKSAGAPDDHTKSKVDDGWLDSVSLRSDSVEDSVLENEEQWDRMNKVFTRTLLRKTSFQETAKETKGSTIVEITETYERNPSVPLERDIRCRKFILDERNYYIEYQPPDGRITTRGIMFTKPDIKSVLYPESFEFTDDMYEEIGYGQFRRPIWKLRVYRDLLNLMRSEDGAVAAAEKAARQEENFLKVREREVFNLKLVPETTDVPRREETELLKQTEYMDALREACIQAEKTDYLVAGLAKIGFKDTLDASDAKIVCDYIARDFVEGFERNVKGIQDLKNKTIEEYKEKVKAYRQREEDDIEEEMTEEELKSFLSHLDHIDTVISALRIRCSWLKKLALEDLQALKRRMREDERLASYFDSLEK